MFKVIPLSRYGILHLLNHLLIPPNRLGHGKRGRIKPLLLSQHLPLGLLNELFQEFGGHLQVFVHFGHQFEGVRFLFLSLGGRSEGRSSWTCREIIVLLIGFKLIVFLLG